MEFAVLLNWISNSNFAVHIKGNDLPRFLILIFPYNHYGGGEVMKIITANKGESVIRIIQSLIGGSAEYYRDSLSPSPSPPPPLPPPPHPIFPGDQWPVLKEHFNQFLKYITMQLILNIAELIWGSHAVSRKTAKDFIYLSKAVKIGNR